MEELILEANISPIEKMKKLDAGEYRNIAAMSDNKLFDNRQICKDNNFNNALIKIEQEMKKRGLIASTTPGGAAVKNKENTNGNDEVFKHIQLDETTFKDDFIKKIVEIAPKDLSQDNLDWHSFISEIIDLDFDANKDFTYPKVLKLVLITLIICIVWSKNRAIIDLQNVIFDKFKVSKDALASFIKNLSSNSAIITLLSSKTKEIQDKNQKSVNENYNIKYLSRNDALNLLKSLPTTKNYNLDKYDTDQLNQILNKALDKEENLMVYYNIRYPNETKICDNCGAQLTDSGQCPKCDLGDEDIDEAIEKHSILNPKLFENGQIKQEVKQALLNIAKEFISTLKENEISINIKDIIITGSNMSYNYTKDSDIDLHIIADLSKYNDKEIKLYTQIFNAYKTIWNKKYTISIYNIPVEVYVESYLGDEDNE